MEDIDLNLLSDEELVLLIQKGHREAKGTLYVRFLGLIHRITYQFMDDYRVPQMFKDELLDESVDALFNAADKFDSSKQYVFFKFWWTIATRALASKYRSILRDKVVLVDPYLIENIKLTDSYQIQDNETVRDVLPKTLLLSSAYFTVEEQSYLELSFKGCKREDICETLNWSKSKYYRVRKKVKNKLNKIF